MKIDLSNPPYAVKLKELGFAYYDYFGLPNILEALGKWDKQYGMDNETTGR